MLDLERPDLLNLDGTTVEASSEAKMDFLKNYREFLTPANMTKLTTDIASPHHPTVIEALVELDPLTKE